MKLFSVKNCSGFTLIEMIVSLGVFSVIATITTGALLSLISSNQRYQQEQDVMTNLSFALDSMTREMRTGYNYYCVSRSNDNNNEFSLSSNDHEDLDINVNSCYDGRKNSKYHGVSFYESGDSITTDPGVNRIMYFFGDTPTGKKLFRKVGDAAPQSVVSDGISIENADFFVSGTAGYLASTPSDKAQPTITIKLQARAAGGTGSIKDYYVQSTVTQRQLDI